MKKVYESSEKTYDDSLGGCPLGLTQQLESRGYHVVLSKDLPDEPKVERCELVCVGGAVRYHRFGTPDTILHWAESDPDFAGFEFADGSIDVHPWRKMYTAKWNEAMHKLDTTQDGDLIHAKYVLFRK